MRAPTGRLLRLVECLDQLGPDPTLVELSQALEGAALVYDDVANYVRPAVSCYHRALVAARPHYELLVMTWLPGQSSPPHDHAGSICAMQVVRGAGAEDLYRVAPDGYVDLEYATPLTTGEITAGQDAGVHVVRNASDQGEPLVTIHIYAPPLKDFRRFVRRPASDAPNPPAAEAPLDLVVVGGGFSGCAVAAQAIRRATAAAPVRVVLVERRGALGEGIAYGTQEDFHRLNVPAAKMSLWPDQPEDFLCWAQRRDPCVGPTDFLPRPWYAEYVRDTLLGAARANAAAAQLSVAFDEVRRIARHPGGGWLVHLARGPSLRTRAVVLAVGHRPPTNPLEGVWTGPRQRFLADAWRPFAMNAVRADEPVVVLGSGLTAVDAVLSLTAQPRQAPITLLSRRGLVPRAHLLAPEPPVNLDELVARLLAAKSGLQIRSLCRVLRREVRERGAQGVDWRRVIDGLRPHTQRLWSALPERERRRFLRHLRPFWEPHRHRMAAPVAQRFAELCQCSLVRVVAGRVASAVASDEHVALTLAPRGTQPAKTLDAAWVVNCTGPSPANQVGSNAAIGSLLVDGWLRADELGLGVATTAEGRAIDERGGVANDLFVVGTLRKPGLWESTAVAELRDQAALVARESLSLSVGAPALSMLAPSAVEAPPFRPHVNG